MTRQLQAAIEQLAPITLDELNHVASLQTRVDRKYLIEAPRVIDLIEALTSPARALAIDGRRQFGYRSMYFDTPAYECFMSSARGRPNRIKVRTRTYLDSGECMIEVKLRDRRRRTVKHRAAHDIDDADQVTLESAMFLESFGGLLPPHDCLRPTLETRYGRTTLLCGDARVTFDFDLRCAEPAGDEFATIADRVIVETKGGVTPSTLDHLLWRAGARPLSISKYAIGLAALRAELPANKWHRVLQRHVVVTTTATIGTTQ